jgi:hypothetical protein
MRSSRRVVSKAERIVTYHTASLPAGKDDMKLRKGNTPILHRLMRHSSMQVTMDYYVNMDDALHDAMPDLR